MNCQSEDTTGILQTFQEVACLINYGVLQMKYGALDEANQTFKVAMNGMKQFELDHQRTMSVHKAMKHTNKNCDQLCNCESQLKSVEISFMFLNTSSTLGNMVQSHYELTAIGVAVNDVDSCSIEDADIFCAILIYNLAILSMLNAKKAYGTLQERNAQFYSKQLLKLSIELLQGHCISENTDTLQILSVSYVLSLAYTSLIYVSKQMADSDYVNELELQLALLKEDINTVSNVASSTWGCFLIQKTAAAA